jgi:hypothetical protein
MYVRLRKARAVRFSLLTNHHIIRFSLFLLLLPKASSLQRCKLAKEITLN